MIGYAYFKGGAFTTLDGSLVKAGLSIGMIGGMVCFGFFGDALGRHKVYGKELIFTLLGTLMVVLTPWKGFSYQSVVNWLTVWRVVTGFGVGGGRLRRPGPRLTSSDYPMSASMNNETKLGMSRAKLILTSFTIYQGGTLIFTFFFAIIVVGFKSRIEADIYNVNYAWRLLL